MVNYTEKKNSFSAFRKKWRRMSSGMAEVVFHMPNIVKKSGFVQSLCNISKIIMLRIPFWPELHKEPRMSIPCFHSFNVTWNNMETAEIPLIRYTGVIKDTVVSPILPSVPVTHWCSKQLRCDGCGTLLEQSINFSVLVGPSFF